MLRLTERPESNRPATSAAARMAVEERSVSPRSGTYHSRRPMVEIEVEDWEREKNWAAPSTVMVLATRWERKIGPAVVPCPTLIAVSEAVRSEPRPSGL